MSDTKFTLETDARIVRLARQVAKRRGTTVSALFSRLILSLAEDEIGETKTKGSAAPITRRACGLLKVSGDYDEREDLASQLSDKYGL